MASTSTMRKNSNGSGHPNDVMLDLETRANQGDHQALRLWLRLLSCTVRIENKITATPAARVQHHAAAL